MNYNTLYREGKLLDDLHPDGATKLWSLKTAKILLVSPTARLKLWFRVGSYTRDKKYLLPLHIFVSLFYRHLKYKTGIQIRLDTKIDGGLHFINFGDVVINASAKIGRNCTIFNGVTIGAANMGERAATIGNNVCLCTGAKNIGDITIGNNVIVGAGAVVVKDVPDNAIVGGCPAKILSYDGATKALNWRH